MEIGKIPNDILKRIILDKIKCRRSEVLVRPNIGEDCCALDFGENICVLSSDPITGAANEVGRLAVHVSCNDIASSGVEPIGIIATVLAPPSAEIDDIDIVMKQMTETAADLNVDIIGGHTEITSAVNRFVIITTGIGRAEKGKMITTSGAEPGDVIIMTKHAGLEGTAILAHDKEEELSRIFGEELIKQAKSFMKDISVVREGVAAGEAGATAMHDATEGGILGALWEVAEASGTGLIVNKDDIPVDYTTKKICEYYNIDALKLISSGCMIITCKNADIMLDKLSKCGVQASVIGKITADKLKIIKINGIDEELQQPGSDELYKII